jgi:hypothetical protein
MAYGFGHDVAMLNFPKLCLSIHIAIVNQTPFNLRKNNNQTPLQPRHPLIPLYLASLSICSSQPFLDKRTSIVIIIFVNYGHLPISVFQHTYYIYSWRIKTMF